MRLLHGPVTCLVTSSVGATTQRLEWVACHAGRQPTAWLPAARDRQRSPLAVCGPRLLCLRDSPPARPAAARIGLRGCRCALWVAVGRLLLWPHHRAFTSCLLRPS